MKLNKVQNRIVVASLLIFLIINIIPPWVTYTNPPEYMNKQNIGYSLIISPPESPLGYDAYVVINYSRLFIQWGVLAFFTIVALILFGKK